MLTRLLQLGLLDTPSLSTVSGVSGGSITAAFLARAISRNPGWGEQWEASVLEPLIRFTRQNIRTMPLLKQYLPWHWGRKDLAVRDIAARLDKELGGVPLRELRSTPRFVFCATDMGFGVNWEFAQDRVGSYLAGYFQPPREEHSIGLAVAASACFPPLIRPLVVEHADTLRLDTPSEVPSRIRAGVLRDLRLTDGGVYDNLGLEPVWKNHALVICSDAGGIFTNQPDRPLLKRISRYQKIQEKQCRSLRKKFLIERSLANCDAIPAVYIAIDNTPATYDATRLDGYSTNLAVNFIATIRTDLDKFSAEEAAILINHGYSVCDGAAKRWLPSKFLPSPWPTLEYPFPNLAPGAQSEDTLERALAKSSKTKILGR